MGKVTTIVADYSKKRYSESKNEMELNKWLILINKDDKKKNNPVNGQVEDYFKFLWKNEHQNLIMDSEYIMRMPHKLKEKLFEAIFQSEKQKFSVYFNTCKANEFIHRLIIYMAPKRINAQDESIINEGEPAKAIYFINRGIVVIRKNSSDYLYFEDGCCFGEDLIIFKNNSLVTYQTCSDVVELFYIMDDMYNKILSAFNGERKFSQIRAYTRRKFLEEVIDAFQDIDSPDEYKRVHQQIAERYSDFDDELSVEDNLKLDEWLKAAEKLSNNKTQDIENFYTNLGSIDSKLDSLKELLLRK